MIYLGKIKNMGKVSLETFYSSLGEKERIIAKKLYPLESELFEIKNKKEEAQKSRKFFKAWVLSMGEKSLFSEILDVYAKEGNCWTAFRVWYLVKEYIFS